MPMVKPFPGTSRFPSGAPDEANQSRMGPRVVATPPTKAIQTQKPKFDVTPVNVGHTHQIIDSVPGHAGGITSKAAAPVLRSSPVPHAGTTHQEVRIMPHAPAIDSVPGHAGGITSKAAAPVLRSSPVPHAGTTHQEVRIMPHAPAIDSVPGHAGGITSKAAAPVLRSSSVPHARTTQQEAPPVPCAPTTHQEVRIVDPKVLAQQAGIANGPIAVHFEGISEPLLHVIPGFLSDAEVDHLLQLSNKNWAQSRTFKKTDAGSNGGAAGGEYEINDARTSMSCLLDQQQTPIIAEIAQRLAQTAGCPVENLEKLNMVKYAPGQFYKAHQDGRHRPKTVFIYLNDLPEGDSGETHFPNLNIKVTPRKGCAMMWSNVSTPGVEDDRLIHEALAPRLGTKYGINCFFNERPWDELVATLKQM